jgi:O-antigen ligase
MTAVAAAVLRRCDRLFRWSMVTFPYISYVGMVGLFIVLVLLLKQFRRTALDRTSNLCLLAISGGMVLSALLAYDRGEAFLQLFNFLPYFLMFGVLPYLLRFEVMQRTARDLVLATLPVNGLALIEYLLKSPQLPLALQQIPLVTWLRSAPHVGRAMLWYGHPNTLASFLVLIFGLGLGVMLMETSRGTGVNGGGYLFVMVGATFANLVGIFASGSRNGLIVAIAQLLLFCFCVRVNPLWRWVGLAGLGAIATAAAILGIGGRSLVLSTWSNDPRVQVWQFALGLVGDRPWLGWGLGNYKLLFPEGLIPGYTYIGHPHNFWLLLAVEVGIPVMVGLTLWVGWVCYRGVRLLWTGALKSDRRAVFLGYCFGFLGCVAFGLFDVTLYDVRVNLMNWVLLAGIYVGASGALQTD